jgi:hypothetical protein
MWRTCRNTIGGIAWPDLSIDDTRSLIPVYSNSYNMTDIFVLYHINQISNNTVKHLFFLIYLTLTNICTLYLYVHEVMYKSEQIICSVLSYQHRFIQTISVLLWRKSTISTILHKISFMRLDQSRQSAILSCILLKTCKTKYIYINKFRLYFIKSLVPEQIKS